MHEKDIAKECVNSLNRNAHLRNSLRASKEPEQRNILTAWFLGYQAANPQSSAAKEFDVDTFITTVTPDIQKAVAA